MATSEPDTIDTYCKRIRDHITSPTKQHQLMQLGMPWLQICSSLDIIEDSQLAISTYRELELPLQGYGFQYLATYGLLQALVIQQDAVRYLTEYLGTPFNPMKSTGLKRVRDVRNSIAGHPSKEDRSGRTSHNFLTRMTLGGGELTYERARLNQESERIRIRPLELIDVQEMELSQRLLELANDLDEQQRLHIERHRGTRVATHLENLGYYFEKMSAHALGSDELGDIGLSVIEAAIDTFRDAVINRDGDLEAFEYLVMELDQASYCMEQLRKFFIGDESGEIASSTMAGIVVTHLKRTFDELATIANDMDADYNQKTIQGVEDE